MRNHLISTLKKFNSSKQQALNEAVIHLNKHEDFTYEIFLSKRLHSPEETLIAKEKVELLENFLETNLTKAEREILKYVIEELSYTEISKFTNKDSKIIDNAIQRIKRKAKAYILKYDSYNI